MAKKTKALKASRKASPAKGAAGSKAPRSPSAKKRTGSQKSPKRAKRTPAGQRSRLEKELRALLPEIDDEGLIFLIRQANVLVNNARVERINKEIAQMRESKGSDARNRAARAERTRPSQSMVMIEEANEGKTFFLTIGEARKVLTLEELKRLIRICYAAETKSDALRQLNTILARERNDILFDARINGPDHPLLEALFTELRAKFRLKDRE